MCVPMDACQVCNCSTCDPLNNSKCFTCRTNYILSLNLCNPNCIILDPNAVTCDVIDETLITSCINNYYISTDSLSCL